MAAERAHLLDLHNDTAINVVGLLKGPVGTARRYGLRLDRFPLAADVAAVDMLGETRLTRLRDGIMAAVEVAGTVELECVRCLRAYAQPFVAEFAEEYRPTVDVRTGAGLDEVAVLDDDAVAATIDENHELDLGEVLRQEILVALPMRPDCGEDCPGPESLLGAPPAAPRDERFAALERLLEDESA